MPQSLTYTEAFQFATYCYIVEEFLSEYGLPYRWRNSMIDSGELMVFVDTIMSR